MAGVYQQCTVGSDTFKNPHARDPGAGQCCPVDVMAAADMACAGGSLWFASGCPLALGPTIPQPQSTDMGMTLDAQLIPARE